MGRLIYSAIASLDGYVADEQGNFDWSAPDEEVHAAWRQLMRENHPDTLASRNVPPRFIEHATRRVAEINNAWTRVKKERGL